MLEIWNVELKFPACISLLRNKKGKVYLTQISPTLPRYTNEREKTDIEPYMTLILSGIMQIDGQRLPVAYI